MMMSEVISGKVFGLSGVGIVMGKSDLWRGMNDFVDGSDRYISWMRSVGHDMSIILDNSLSGCIIGS